MTKIHIKYKNRALCGQREGKAKLKFVSKAANFDNYPDGVKCLRCKRVSET
jgi:hypothetical protein